MAVGENIRRIRKARGLTQKELGKLCGIAEPNIRKYELNKANPKYETLKKIADALNTHPLVLKGIISEEYASSISQKVDNVTAFMSLLRNMYGYIDERVVTIPGVGNAFYYVLGEGNNQFAISESVFEHLFDAVQEKIRSIIKSAATSEEEEIKSCQEILTKIKDTEIFKKYIAPLNENIESKN